MYIKSIELDGLVGYDLERAYYELKYHANKYSAEEVFCIFNTHKITSNMTEDECFIEVLGCTKNEHNRRRKQWEDEYDKREKEHKEVIPSLTVKYIELAKGIISEDKMQRWCEIVPIRLGDMYKGMELDCTLKLVKMLDIDKCTLEEAKEELESQGHSGCSYGLEYAMIKEFCVRVDEFLKYIDRH